MTNRKFLETLRNVACNCCCIDSARISEAEADIIVTAWVENKKSYKGYDVYPHITYVDYLDLYPESVIARVQAMIIAGTTRNSAIFQVCHNS